MFDILQNIWKSPTPTHTPMPIWCPSESSFAEELTSQINEMHKKGIDGFVLSADSLTSESLVCIASEAKKRRMMIALRVTPPSDPALCARVLTPRKTDDPLTDGENALFRVWIKTDDSGALLETSLVDKSADGFAGYDLVLTTAPDCDDADVLNPASAQSVIDSALDPVCKTLAEYFANTVIGISADGIPAIGIGDGSIAWSWSTIEEFFSCGGEIDDLCALLFPVKVSKKRREAEFIYRKAIRAAVSKSYLTPLGEWCRNHGIAMMGHPADVCDCDSMKYFEIPGQKMSSDAIADGEELTSPASPLMKCASDSARHNGISRCSAEVCVSGSDSPDQVMRRLNYLFARGCNMVIPSGIESVLTRVSDADERNDMKKISGYIKRMSWLNTTGTNNPDACVLCSGDYMPRTPVESLYRKGYTFNYLTLYDLMTRAHIDGGKISIDRYKYGIVLIDQRLRMSAEHVVKLGHFVTGGGLMYRGNDFGSFMEKHVKKTSYFEGETYGNLRFVRLTKSGCPFFVLINEGERDIVGRLVTDLSCGGYLFDALSGDVNEMPCEMCDGGFAYDVRVAGHSSVVIGMDAGSLPKIGSPDIGAEKRKLVEVCALSESRMTFEYRRTHASRVVLTFEKVHRATGVRLNGEDAGRVMVRPYEIDVTPHLIDGVNTVEIDGDAVGAVVRMYE